MMSTKHYRLFALREKRVGHSDQMNTDWMLQAQIDEKFEQNFQIK